MASEPLLRTFLDSGPPEGSTDYTTVVIVHGYGFHGGNFKKLLPLAHKHNARVVLPNRRDYPGSTPFSPDERADLSRIVALPAGSSEAVAGTQDAMKQRARELYDYLVHLVRTDRNVTRPVEGGKGGIVLAGWSLGATWILALLAHVADFPVDDVRLTDFARRVVFYDASHVCLGYPLPKELYHPLHDPLLSPEERVAAFNVWVSSYFAHGDVAVSGLAALESRNPLTTPPPSITNMTAEDLAESTDAGPGAADGSESLLIRACLANGTYGDLRYKALYLRDLSAGQDDWRAVETRYVWCDHSTWEMPMAQWDLSNELTEAREAGKEVRNIRFVRFRGANHFAHWDLPEPTLHAFLGNESNVADF